MEKRSVEAIVCALNDAKVRYLIVGGLAVVAHGYVRFTQDVDLLLDFDEENLRKAVAALSGLGYRPLAPVPFEQFVDAGVRSQWIRDKGLTVFSLFSPAHPKTEVDLFVQAPLDFEKAYVSAWHQDVTPGLPATFVGLEDLVFLKKKAGRPEDLEDINQLQKLDRESASE